MLLGVIADDFTGASDVANTLARGGMATRLFVGVQPDTGGCEAGVIALKSRSIAPADAVRQALVALDALLASGSRQLLFKTCSTFDSTREGNIGPVIAALAAALGVRGVVVCPAFPGAGRTLYQGHLFVGDRLLSESGMERHPLTPMTDPDIRRWLGHQLGETPGHVALPTVREGARAIRAALAGTSALAVVVDEVADDDLRAIGEALADARLLSGGSGIAIGLPENFRRAGLLGAASAALTGNDGAALLLSGSCSVATRGQVRVYAAAHPTYAIDIDHLLGGAGVLAEAEAFMCANRDAAPLITSTAEPAQVSAAQARHGMEASAAAVEALFGALARAAIGQGFGRIVAAGGETSGAVVTALGLGVLELGPEIDPGVPALSTRTGSGAPLALALKSGNFGAPDFFANAVAALGAGHG